MNLESIIKQSWEDYNSKGIITYRSDTLSKKQVEHEGVNFSLIHNGSRDVYDKQTKPVPKPASKTCPFCDDSNPELAEALGGQFKIFGNRFACLPYQSILATANHQEKITLDFLNSSLSFAQEHPKLTLLHNSRNAGKTVAHLFWLLSFQHYPNLTAPPTKPSLVANIGPLTISHCLLPAYSITFSFGSNTALAAKVLLRLIEYMDHKNFNILIFRHMIYFIPRAPVETPEGFAGHRFGGLELIGSFVMKSKVALESADPERLYNGIRQISFKEQDQQQLEAFIKKIA